MFTWIGKEYAQEILAVALCIGTLLVLRTSFRPDEPLRVYEARLV